MKDRWQNEVEEEQQKTLQKSKTNLEVRSDKSETESVTDNIH